MRKPLAFGAAALVLAAMGAACFAFFVPKIGRATKAEIQAALPASLKAKDAADPEGEARYGRLVELAVSLDGTSLKATRPGEARGRSTAANEKTLGEIEALLKEGGLRIPVHKGDGSFGDLTAVKNAAKLMAVAATDARERGDRAACGRWVSVGLRYAQAVEGAGGVVIDGLVALAVDGIAVRSVYLSEIGGGLDGGSRARLLTMLRPRDGTSPAMAAAVRRDFTFGWMPILLDPQRHEKDLAGNERLDFTPGEDRAMPPFAGTFDPVEAAKLGGAIYDATMADLLRPPRRWTHDDARLVSAAGKGLPGTPPSPTGSGSVPNAWERLRYRMAMNAGHNTLGRFAASMGVFAELAGASARQAVDDDLVRAVLLLRMGRTAAIHDPYGKGDLRIDSRREIVWSVGKDGKDDGGRIGKGFDNAAPDLGYPYGDGG